MCGFIAASPVFWSRYDETTFESWGHWDSRGPADLLMTQNWLCLNPRPGSQSSLCGLWSRWEWEVPTLLYLTATSYPLGHHGYPFPTREWSGENGSYRSDPATLMLQSSSLAASYVVFLSVPSHPAINNEEVTPNHRLSLMSFIFTCVVFHNVLFLSWLKDFHRDPSLYFW